MENQQVTNESAGTDSPCIYEIRVQGHLSKHWEDWFDNLSITPMADGTTCLSGKITDQAMLHSILKRIRDAGMVLLSINQVKISTINKDSHP